MAGHVYAGDFYEYIDNGSRNSARCVARYLLSQLRIESLLDVGAGHGAWAAEWQRAGVNSVVAVDGDYVDRNKLAIASDCFIPHDLERPLDLGRRFDLVQSLEVAEHLSASHSDQFVESLVRHGDVILFSAAVPYQGGEHHVNEQLPEYWRAKFARHGYAPYDGIRPHIAAEKAVMPWYRFNSLLYVNEAGTARLSDAIRATRVPDGQAIAVGGDLAWHMRRAAVRLIPAGLVKPIAMAKARFTARRQRANR